MSPGALLLVSIVQSMHGCEFLDGASARAESAPKDCKERYYLLMTFSQLTQFCLASRFGSCVASRSRPPFALPDRAKGRFTSALS